VDDWEPHIPKHLTTVIATKGERRKKKYNLRLPNNQQKKKRKREKRKEPNIKNPRQSNSAPLPSDPYIENGERGGGKKALALRLMVRVQGERKSKGRNGRRQPVKYFHEQILCGIHWKMKGKKGGETKWWKTGSGWNKEREGGTGSRLTDKGMGGALNGTYYIMARGGKGGEKKRAECNTGPPKKLHHRREGKVIPALNGLPPNRLTIIEDI